MYFMRSNPKSTVKKTVMHQYRAIANSAVEFRLFTKPKEGWVRTIRSALGMSGSQLGERMGFSRNRISVLERKEVEGDITLNQLQGLAEQLNCDLTYALVPRKPIEDIIDGRATEIASRSLDANSQNMFLEDQTISGEAQIRLLNQIKEQIIESGGRALWKNIKE
ncbi:DNA-binding protein [Shewanella saliphila]|uniref:DNA-binding protein n=2 Tax=Shewanella saliphila TaxID=2282698 RepID=A0ABQ2QBI9_9GAMM|nr:DNA-binding protein [Shewanella saliphila]